MFDTYSKFKQLGVYVILLCCSFCNRSSDIIGTHDSFADDNMDTTDIGLDSTIDISDSSDPTHDPLIDHVIPHDVIDIVEHDIIEDDISEVDGPCHQPGMVYIEDISVCVDKYEASRPDATSSSSGVVFGPAQSVSGVKPWLFVTWSEANEACALAGKVLCPKDIWYHVCSRGDTQAYPYGDAYDSSRCVGAYYGFAYPQNTGMLPCVGGYPGVYDMSGNASEWTGDCISDECYTNISDYTSYETELRCDNISFVPNITHLIRIGFRCCLTSL